MATDSYTQGFLNAISYLEKQAQTAEEILAERKKREALGKEMLASRKIKKEPYKNPSNFTVALKQFGRNAVNRIKSTGIGIGTALGVGATRALGSAVDLGLWIPQMVDKFVFGKMLGVDKGQGILGRAKGKFDRFLDRQVGKMRAYSRDFDYQHNIDGKFNRFLNGRLADTAGTIIGGAGLGGLASIAKATGARKILPIGFAALGGMEGYSADSRYGQQRAKEEQIRKMPTSLWRYQDPTSTAYHQENSPTDAEFRRYHTPNNLPTTSTGRIYVPQHWMRRPDSSLVNFRPYGT